MALGFKKELSLKHQFYLFFWIPFLILVFVALYYPLKIKKYFSKNEIFLPQEYRIIFEQLKKMDYAKVAKKRSEVIFKTNPFLAQESLPNLSNQHLLPSNRLTLTSILHTNRKVCIINGKLYKEKDKINNIQILKIGDYYVELLLPNKKRILLEVGATYTFSE